MDRPYIIIGEQYIFMPTPKARVWRELMQFEESRKNINFVDAIEKYCEVISKVFGVSTDEILDNLNVDEILPTYFSILNCVVAMLTEKLITDKKNVVDAAET